MAIGTSFFIIAALIAVIWVFVEFKRLRHKLFAMGLIALIVLTYVSFAVSLSGHDIDYTTPSGIIDAGKLYFSWLGGMFSKFKTITAYALKLDWNEYNTSVIEENGGGEKEEGIWEKL